MRDAPSQGERRLLTVFCHHATVVFPFNGNDRKSLLTAVTKAENGVKKAENKRENAEIERSKAGIGREKVEDEWMITPVFKHLPLAYPTDFMLLTAKAVEGGR